MQTPFDWSAYAVGGARRPDSFTGLDVTFRSAMEQAMLAAPPEVRQATRVVSAFRSPERQRELWEQALQRHGSVAAARRWVAPPGASQHNHGRAMDLRYLTPAAQQWWHENAAQFGLSFPMGHEPWHIEPKSARQPKTAQGETPQGRDLIMRVLSGETATPAPSQEPAPQAQTLVATRAAPPPAQEMAPAQAPAPAPPEAAMPTGSSLWDRVFPPATLEKLGPLGDEERRLRIAAILFSLGVAPNPQLIAALNNQVETLQKQRRTNKETSRTAQWLETQGRSDLAAAVRSGAMTGRDAAAILYAPSAGATSQPTANMRNVEFLVEQFVATGMAPEEARKRALEVGFGITPPSDDTPASMRTFKALRDQLIESGATPEAATAAASRKVFGADTDTRISEAEGVAAARARVENLAALAGTAPQLQENLAQLSEMRRLIEKEGASGRVPGLLEHVGRMFNVSLNTASDEQLRAIGSRMAMMLRPLGSGAISDADLAAFFAAIPALGNSREGNILIANTLEAVFNFRLQAARIAQEGIASGDTAASMRKIAALSDPLIGFNERSAAILQKQTQAAPAAGAAAPAAGGWQTDPNTGIRYRVIP